MGISRIINDALLSRGLKVVRASSMYAFRRNQLLGHAGIDLVLDVGANAGQFGTELRRHGYHGDILSFEPLASAFEHLTGVSKQDSGWRAFPLAIGDEPGVMTMHVAGNSESSSLLPMNQNHLNAAPYAAYQGTEQVRVATLDELFGVEIPKNCNLFLKLDTQGYEAHALRGASAVLADVKLIECEMSLVPLYEGELLFPQMYALLEQLGFEPVGFDPVFYDEKTGRCMQVDVLFSRRQR